MILEVKRVNDYFLSFFVFVRALCSRVTVFPLLLDWAICCRYNSRFPL